jgi:hypothetical protein
VGGIPHGDDLRLAFADVLSIAPAAAEAELRSTCGKTLLEGLKKLLNVFRKTSKCFWKNFEMFFRKLRNLLWAIRHSPGRAKESKETAMVLGSRLSLYSIFGS